MTVAGNTLSPQSFWDHGLWSPRQEGSSVFGRDAQQEIARITVIAVHAEGAVVHVEKIPTVKDIVDDEACFDLVGDFVVDRSVVNNKAALLQRVGVLVNRVFGSAFNLRAGPDRPAVGRSGELKGRISPQNVFGCIGTVGVAFFRRIMFV